MPRRKTDAERQAELIQQATPKRPYKNNILQDDAMSATPKELREFTKHALEIFEIIPPDLHDAKQVYDAISNYFRSCDTHGVRPSNLGLYASLGMTRQDVDDVIRGKNKSRASHECIDMIQRAKLALSAYRESLAMSGKINPVTALFWSKNFDGMTDVQQVEITANNAQQASLSPEEIASRIEKDIPIDADFTETV